MDSDTLVLDDKVPRKKISGKVCELNVVTDKADMFFVAANTRAIKTK